MYGSGKRFNMCLGPIRTIDPASSWDFFPSCFSRVFTKADDLGTPRVYSQRNLRGVHEELITELDTVPCSNSKNRNLKPYVDTPLPRVGTKEHIYMFRYNLLAKFKVYKVNELFWVSRLIPPFWSDYFLHSTNHQLPIKMRASDSAFLTILCLTGSAILVDTTAVPTSEDVVGLSQDINSSHGCKYSKPLIKITD